MCVRADEPSVMKDNDTGITLIDEMSDLLCDIFLYAGVISSAVCAPYSSVET